MFMVRWSDGRTMKTRSLVTAEKMGGKVYRRVYGGYAALHYSDVDLSELYKRAPRGVLGVNNRHKRGTYDYGHT